MRRCMCLLPVAIFPFAAGCICLPDPIHQTLMKQSVAWNRGDIDGFMSAYWNSPELTFASGGTVNRGFAATLERYKTKYPTTKEMGKLTFSDLDIRLLSRRYATVLGRWKLEREQPIEGLFTLVMRRERGKWIIIHDHTSVADMSSSAGVGHSKPTAGN